MAEANRQRQLRKSAALPEQAPPAAPAPIHEFPLLDQLDVQNMKTGVKDANGNELTVSSLTIKTLMEKYKKGIDDGTLKENDARYKFYYAMQAASDVAFGRGITPYFENGPNGGKSERWEGDDYDATAADMQGMYNTGKRSSSKRTPMIQPF